MPKKSTIDRKKFFDHVRKFLCNGELSSAQVEGMDAILDEWEERGLTDLRWLSYMMATTFHETGRSMQPVKEWGRGAGKPYGKKLKMGGGPNKRIPYDKPDHIYFGRSFVQLTWYENYELMGRLLGIDLLNNPDKALEMEVSVKILFEGMLKAASSFGDFTGKCLEQYFNETTDDPINARKVVNGLDKADLIASYHYVFLKALT